MTDVRITINGRSYDVACDPGQEQRVLQLASFIDQRVHQIARSGGAYNDSHLMVLALLTVADELLGGEYVVPAASPKAAKTAPSREDMAALTAAAEEAATRKLGEKAAKEADLVAKAITKIAKRMDSLAAKVEAA